MYKFYNIPEIEILDKIIGVNPTIKFSSAFDLNDPFELKFNLELNVNDETHKQEFLINNPNSSEIDFENWKQQVKNNEGFLWYNEQKTRNDLAQRISLCSFTINNSNNLMWSHYTNNHRGICVEYDKLFAKYLISNTDFICSNLVNYSESPPTINTAKDRENIISKALFNKQIEWKYEQEHRIVIWSNNNVDYIKFPRNFIKAVYVGAKANNQLISKVLDLCKPNGIKVLYGIALGKTYEVTFREDQAETFYSRSFWS